MKPSKKVSRRIALQRIRVLFDLAEHAADSDMDQARRYLQLAKRISEKSNVPIPQSLKRQYCRSCYTVLKAGKTAIVSMNAEKKTRNVTCEYCGRTYRYPYKQLQEERYEKPDDKAE